MNKVEFIEYIKNELKNKRNIDINYTINGIVYRVKFLGNNNNSNINIPRIIIIPQISVSEMNTQIVFESNNLETDDLSAIIEQGGKTGIRLATLTIDRPCPIVIPLIPSEKEEPYYQQLSRECFELKSTNSKYRIDEQIVKIINQTKAILKEQYSIKAKEKIFLNGYSSSGVFAQRFALLHPELVETVCIGGASGSIPIPSKDIGYPIGIEDYEELFGKVFDMESYSSIDFRYYVGELETVNKTDTRFDEAGMPAPMHDMSYFYRSVPTEIGKKQRNKLGKDMFERANRTVKFLKTNGIHITHSIIRGRTHNNKSGQGVNELGDKFIIDTYKEKSINKVEDSTLYLK